MTRLIRISLLVLLLELCKHSTCLERAACAQSTHPGGTAQIVAEREPLARYVPQSAGLYLRFSDSSKWRELLNQPVMAGDSHPTSLHDQGLTALSKILADRPVAMAANSWRDRKEMITILAPNEPAAFAQSFQLTEAEIIHTEGAATVYRVASRIFVATDNRIFVVSGFGMDSPMFESSIKLLGAESRTNLCNNPEFQGYVLSSDPTASGLIFFQHSSPAVGAELQTLPYWLPRLRAGCVEVHLKPDRVECHIKARRWTPAKLDPKHPLSGAAFKLLPDSAIAIINMSVDVPTWMADLARYLPKEQNAPLRQLYQWMLQMNLVGDYALADLGPEVTLCLLEGSGENGSEWAVVVAGRRVTNCGHALAIACKKLSMSSPSSAQDSGTASYHAYRYGEHEIHNLEYRREDALNPLPWELSEFRLAFTIIKGHLVLANHPNAIEQMIRISEDPERAFITVVDPEMACMDGGPLHFGYLDPKRLARELRPLSALLSEKNAHHLQSHPWFQQLLSYVNEVPVQLGARLAKSERQFPGKVRVISVLEGWPADGVLKPGDAIMAVDGVSLALLNSRQDLRNKLQEKTAGGATSLRIERHGQLMDVQVILPPLPRKSFRALLTDTGKAVDYLEILGQQINRVSYCQSYTSHRLVNAHMILELRNKISPSDTSDVQNQRSE